LKTPEELGEFVISSTLLASTAEELESKIGMTLEEWREICKFATRDFMSGEMFRNILMKKLSEVFWFTLSIKRDMANYLANISFYM